MIQRSGLSARSRSPISAATARTCSTFALSSVSGMVKNCGACGSMAPPTTVEIIDPSPWLAWKLTSPAQDNKERVICRLPRWATMVVPGLPVWHHHSRPTGQAADRVVGDLDRDLGPAFGCVVVLGVARADV